MEVIETISQCDICWARREDYILSFKHYCEECGCEICEECPTFKCEECLCNYHTRCLDQEDGICNHCILENEE